MVSSVRYDVFHDHAHARDHADDATDDIDQMQPTWASAAKVHHTQGDRKSAKSEARKE
jgi:hypothetical protein